jgi:uncharacterized phage protein (TIGR02218 family)
MPNFLDGELTSFAFLWRLSRRDGVTLGFTNHDHDLWRGGLRYRATPGMVPSAIERSDGFDADTVELSGALTHDALRADDFLSGRWDGGRLTLVAVDWTEPEGDIVPLARGELGTVETAGSSFRVELRGPSAILDAPVCEETSPDCRASLGDRRCRVDLAGRRALAEVQNVSGAVVTLNQSAADGIYAFGRLRWLEGANAGLVSVIAASAGATVTLREPPPFAATAGARVEITEGCDRRFETCAGRFANAINFRGEPHLPGTDLLTRYAS